MLCGESLIKISFCDKGEMVMTTNHKRKKLKKRLARHTKAVEKHQVANAWRNIFVRAGIIK